MYQCTACRQTFSAPTEPRSCPHCGARFGGRRDVTRFLPTPEEEAFKKHAQQAAIWLIIIAVLAALVYFGIRLKFRVGNENKLYAAAEAGDTEQVKTLLDEGIDVNAENASQGNSTALMVAAESGKADLVRLLVSRGAELHTASKDGDTALGLAWTRGHGEAVKALLEADLGRAMGAEPDVEGTVNTYSSRIDDRSIYFHPNIPPGKLKNAVEAYAHLTEGERPLALIDDTIMRSATDGVLLTNKSIYARNASQPFRSYFLGSISSVKFAKGTLTDALRVNGDDFYVRGIPGPKAVAMFSDMLTAIASQFPKTAPPQAASPAPAIAEAAAGVESIVRSYSARIRDDYIFFHPNIPPDKLKEAMASYAPLKEGERPLALIDTSGLGTDGFLLSDRSIYAHNAPKSPVSLPLGSVSSVKFDDGWLIDTIQINGGDFYIASLPKGKSLALFTEMLSAVTKRPKP